MKLLIDTELYVYRAATVHEFEAEWEPDIWSYFCRHDDAKVHIQDDIADICDLFPDGQVVLCFGAKASFRYGVWPAYKANRKIYRKPAGYRELWRWLESVAPTRNWQLARLPDVEADDVLGILHEPGDVIVSWDKDLKTVPGLHLCHDEVVEVSEHEADQRFFTQVLTGDTADNYPGCPGAGPVKAAELLAGCETPLQMWHAVLGAYRKKQLTERDAITQARCARILRAGEYDHDNGTPVLWNPPVA